MDTSLLTQRRRRGCWPDSKVPPIILPSWYSHPCGIPPTLFQGDPCDHDMAGMPHITSRLGYKRRCGFLSLCCSLSSGSLALGEASCHVLRTLGQPSGEALRPVPGGQAGNHTSEPESENSSLQTTATSAQRDPEPPFLNTD